MALFRPLKFQIILARYRLAALKRQVHEGISRYSETTHESFDAFMRLLVMKGVLFPVLRLKRIPIEVEPISCKDRKPL